MELISRSVLFDMWKTRVKGSWILTLFLYSHVISIGTVSRLNWGLLIQHKIGLPS